MDGIRDGYRLGMGITVQEIGRYVDEVLWVGRWRWV